MKENLDTYIRKRIKELGLSVSKVSDVTKLSRQTLYSLGQSPDKLPTLKTIILLAEVLRIHPLRLLNLLFDDVKVVNKIFHRHRSGDQSAFVRDVSFADGALVLPRQKFTKTWELQNTGRVVWEGRFLQCMDEEIIVHTLSGETLSLAHNLIPSEKRIPMPRTEPGGTVQLSVEFTAPESPGTVLSYWKSVFADGALCFPNGTGVWVKVRVNTAASGVSEDRS